MTRTVEQYAERITAYLEANDVTVGNRLYASLLKDAQRALNGFPCEVQFTQEELEDIASNIDPIQNLPWSFASTTPI